MKEIVELRKLTSPISFRVKISTDKRKFTVIYGDEYEDEIFSNFSHFLNSLSDYYRNRIDILQDQEDKIQICNQFIDTVQNYKLDLKDLFKNKEDFFSEITLYVEQFSFYKDRIKEQENLKLSTNSNVEKEAFSTKQQVLILHYLGFLDLISYNTSDKIKAEIVASVIGKDITNVTRAIRNNHKIVEKGQENTKTRANLEAVKKFFQDKKQQEIVDKIEEELNTLKKG